MKKAKNWHEYFSKQIEQCRNYAALELVFRSFEFAEEIKEGKNPLFEKEQILISQIKESLHLLGKGNGNHDAIIRIMSQTREDITGKMDLLTTYVDRLAVFDRVLRTMKWKYKKEQSWESGVTKEKENKFVQDLMFYVFASRDRIVMNGKIRTILGQLPIRMTREKFLERLREAISLYKGDEKKVLDDFLYRIRTNGMLYEPKRFIGEFETFDLLLERLNGFDFENCSAEMFEAMDQEVADYDNKFQKTIDFYYFMQKITNIIYASAIISKYPLKRSNLHSDAMEVIYQILEGDIQEEALIPFEGKIEQYAERHSHLEALIYDVKKLYGGEIERLNLVNTYEDIRMILILLSDHLFLSIEEQKNNEMVEEQYIKLVCAKLTAEFEEIFSKYKKKVRRAIMGNVIEQLPIRIRSTDELRQHIEQTLFQCQDEAEKISVMETLEQWMIAERSEMTNI